MTANSVVNQIFQSESFVLQKGLNCPKPTIQCSWYTRKPFPVPNPRFKAVGTPDGLSLYKTHDSRRLVHQTAFSCTKSMIQCGWYTRRPFPVQTPRLKAVGTPESLFLYKPTIQGGWYTRRPFPVQNPRFMAIGTPDGLFLYKLHDSKRLVHQKAFSCTNSNHQIE